MKPEEMLNSILSREDFFRFLEILIAERRDSLRQEQSKVSSPYSAAVNGWENTSIENFLEAMRTWALDSQALEKEPCWRDFAQLLIAGKSYE